MDPELLLLHREESSADAGSARNVAGCGGREQAEQPEFRLSLSQSFYGEVRRGCEWN